jgi:hypothetical protein
VNAALKPLLLGLYYEIDNENLSPLEGETRVRGFFLKR